MKLRNFLIRILPIPKGIKLNWNLAFVEKAYEKDIRAASKINNWEEVGSLKGSQRWEMALVEEEIGHYLTQQLLQKARKLKVPVPYRTTSDSDEDLWVQGHQTGNWYFTAKGYSFMRSEIRKELKEIHEIRAHWVVWFSALTGIIGAFTGLLAVFSKS